MHRHGYKRTKFHRERDQRRALIKGLADSLIKYESIETTLPKAKTLVPYVEKLITKAKKADLHNRRLIISKLQTIESAHKLVDEIAPKLSFRNSGHLRIEKTTLRRGDNSQLASISFVDEIKGKPAKSEEKTKTDKAKSTTKSESDLVEDTNKSKTPERVSKMSMKTINTKVAKRSGVRGNK